MEKKRIRQDTILVWEKGQKSAKEEKMPSLPKKRKPKDEEIILGLQRVFGKSRYQSWVSYQLKHS